MAGPDIPGSRTLLVGDHFFGPGNVDGDMPRGAPGATVLAVGGLADPDLDNAFVWPAQGHQAAMEIGRALAAVKPVEQAPVEEPPISAEAKRAIKGFSWARTFSIAASALYMIAFSALAVDHVGRQTFATINTFSSLVAIPLAFINGTLVDKLTPRQILIGGALVLAGVGAAAAALTAAGLINIWTLVPLTILLQMMQIAIVEIGRAHV